MSTWQRRMIIRTPEGVQFALLIANPIVRFLALAIDLVCISLLGSLAGVALSWMQLFGSDLAGAAIMLALFVVTVGYGMSLEWFWRGQTLGKRVLGLRVIDEQGLHLRFSQVALRNVLRAVDALPAFYLVGGVVALLSPRGQRLGDIAGSTLVIQEPLRRRPDLTQLAQDKYNSLRDHPHLVARLRNQVPRELAAIALQAMVRRESLAPAARLAVFADLRRALAGIVAFPAETVEPMSDEQYVRNVADAIFRNGTAA